LDYSWHVVYSKQRRILQDKIITTLIGKYKPIKNPLLLFTGGPMGAGKGHLIKWFRIMNIIPNDKFIHIDPDYIKDLLPEASQYKKLNPQTAATLLHEESCIISDIILRKAMWIGLGVILDGTLRNADYYKQLIGELKMTYSNYKYGIIYVLAEWKTIMNRCIKRSWETQRTVPLHILEKSYNSTENSYQILKNEVDWIYRFDNNNEFPILLDNKSISEFVSQFDKIRDGVIEKKIINQFQNGFWSGLEI